MPGFNDPETLGDIFAPSPPVPTATPQVEVEGGTLGDDLRSLQQVQQPDADPAAALLYGMQRNALQQHEQYAQELQSRGDEARARGQDLALSGRLLKAFDPQFHPALRKGLLRGISRDLHIDPDGAYGKELIGMVTRLDSDSLSGVRTLFSSRMDSAQPGEVSQLARGILSGSVPLHDVLDQIGTMRREEAASSPMMLGGPRGMGVPQPDPLAEPAQATAPAPAAAPTDTRTVDPSIATALGYDARTTPSADILRTHPGIANLDAKAQQKLATELSTARNATLETLNDAAKIRSIINGHPEALTPGGWPHVGSAFVGAVDWIHGVGRTFGIDLDKALPNAESEPRITPEQRDFIHSQVPQISGRLGFSAGREANRIIDGAPPTGVMESARTAADRHAEVQNILVKMAYSSLRAADPGGRFSNQDIDMEMRRIGASLASPRTAETALRTHAAGQLEAYNRKIEAITGGAAVPLNMPQGVLDLLGTAAPATQQTPPGVTVRPVQTTPVTPNPAVTPNAPPAETPVAPQGGMTPEQQSIREGQRLRDDVEVGQRTRRLQLEDIPEQQRRARQSSAIELANLQLRMDEAKERKDERAYRHARDAKADAEKQQARIQAAFSQLARALASGSSGGGGSLISGGGGDQSEAAFRLAPSPQRSAPSPVQAQSGQTMPIQRGSGALASAEIPLPRQRSARRRRRA